jgi:hypothetical protein
MDAHKRVVVTVQRLENKAERAVGASFQKAVTQTFQTLSNAPKAVNRLIILSKR